MSREQVPPEDPLGLEAVDRAIRINEMTERLEGMGMSSMHVSEDCPDELHEEFLRNIEHIESGPLSTHFKVLEEAGVGLPAPNSLDDAALHAKLWEVIEALAKRDTLLHHTDHLSDRQLYEHLWGDSLREETTIMPAGSGWTCHLDLISSGSEEDNQISLRYYDDEEHRERWAKDFPEDVIPPHEDLPHDRDRFLPRGVREEPDGPECCEEDESGED